MGLLEEGAVVGAHETEREHGAVDGGVAERDVGHVARDDFGSAFRGL